MPRLAIPLLIAAVVTPAAALDLTNAAVVSPPGLSLQEAKAVTLLIEEVEKRSGIRWEPASATAPATIEITRTTGPAEGYSIRTTARAVTIAGNDARGVLFGIGRKALCQAFLIKLLKRLVAEAPNLHIVSCRLTLVNRLRSG